MATTWRKTEIRRGLYMSNAFSATIAGHCGIQNRLQAFGGVAPGHASTACRARHGTGSVSRNNMDLRVEDVDS
jgi:hypothetical protein